MVLSQLSGGLLRGTIEPVSKALVVFRLLVKQIRTMKPMTTDATSTFLLQFTLMNLPHPARAARPNGEENLGLHFIYVLFVVFVVVVVVVHCWLKRREMVKHAKRREERDRANEDGNGVGGGVGGGGGGGGGGNGVGGGSGGGSGDSSGYRLISN